MKRRAVIFTGFALLLAWIPCIWLMASGAVNTPTTVALVFSGCMFAPALASLLTRAITREGFGEMRLHFHFRGNLRYYLAAWFGPSLFIAVGAAVYFLVFPAQLDPSAASFAAQLGVPADQLRSLLLSQIALGVLAGPLINVVPALGEELGWRGYLLPRLLKITTPAKAVLLSGVIWGVWHTPMIAMGHNYGTGYLLWPWAGIAAMTVFCIAVGIFLAWIAEKTDSAWPCAMAHAGLNAVAGTAAYFTVAGGGNPFVGPLPTGIIGGIGFLVCAAVLFALLPKWLPAHDSTVED
ncbi:CPBP family intramembrane glutamic endopeptidase [Pygmaiobacter massiliensis]|uniref:CPBP family intramembrane glutamic endopeptidase n=1 Tax=Pygmaiobacter massiliensis TaxID=1917873 RepID=UPI000C7D2492|nr:CPBP family intramembrane glutamic endopeptidase [Pygmaiobacter massiliensis]